MNCHHFIFKIPLNGWLCWLPESSLGLVGLFLHTSKHSSSTEHYRFICSRVCVLLMTHFPNLPRESYGWTSESYWRTSFLRCLVLSQRMFRLWSAKSTFFASVYYNCLVFANWLDWWYFLLKQFISILVSPYLRVVQMSPRTHRFVTVCLCEYDLLIQKVAEGDKPLEKEPNFIAKPC